MGTISDLALKSAALVYSLARFSVRGKHPRRGAIVRAYLRLLVKVGLYSIVNRRVRSLSFLGRKIRFASPNVVSFLLMELFIEENYKGCDRPPATIVDLGSNVGMSILLFKSLWPDCSVLGVEASPEIFELLQQNVRGLAEVTVVNRAVSDRSGQIMFYSTPGSLTGSTNSLRGSGAGVAVESTPMSEFIHGPIDLLKIDVEGSEMDAFAELEASGKLSLLRQMFIEYHHHLPQESRSLAAFLERLERNGFEYELGAQLPDLSGDMQDILIRARNIGAPGASN